MNKKIKGLNRTMVYSFLIGLILGGIIIGWVDANAKTPLFSSASRQAPGQWTSCIDNNGEIYPCQVATQGDDVPGGNMGTGGSGGQHKATNTNTQLPTNTTRSTK